MFISQALKGRNDWWLYVIMFLILLISQGLGQLPLFFAVNSKFKSDPALGTDDLNQFYETMDFTQMGISLNMGFFLLILSFVILLIIFWFAFPLLHQRAAKTLISIKEKIDWKKVFFAFGVWFTIGALFEGVIYLTNPDMYTFQFNLQSFAVLMLLSILILPFQTSAEEIIFRGYLMQGIGVGTRSRIIPLIITSILFGLVHSANPEIHKFGFITMQFYYMGAGLILGIMTLMDDSLELALGVHAATNFIGATLVGYDGAAIQTDSLFKTSYLNTSLMTVGFYICGIIFLIICAKKYKWQSFKKLLEKPKFVSSDLL